MGFRRSHQNMEEHGTEAGPLLFDRDPYAGVAGRVPGSSGLVSDGDSFRSIPIISRFTNRFLRGDPAYQIV